MAAKAKPYTCIRRVLHNGKRYLPTDAIQLGDEHATPLLALGAIRAKPSPAKAAQKAPDLDKPAAESTHQQ
jgi:hypothetical protein